MKSVKNIANSTKNYLQDRFFQGRSFWFVLFLTLLAVLSIRAGHSVDEKVLEISTLKNDLKELEAEYLESKSKLMQLGMESQVLEKGKSLGLQSCEEPPQKIVLKVE
ncbi:MAG: FtsL-like putative cell division protein [Schleiferiaceae bacterium]|jgi:hypothetical protein|nr:FtsL-like putative cell division protein [Schleiferiaceae bacterium]